MEASMEIVRKPLLRQLISENIGTHQKHLLLKCRLAHTLRPNPWSKFMITKECIFNVLLAKFIALL